MHQSDELARTGVIDFLYAYEHSKYKYLLFVEKEKQRILLQNIP